MDKKENKSTAFSISQKRYFGEGKAEIGKKLVKLGSNIYLLMLTAFLPQLIKSCKYRTTMFLSSDLVGKKN